MSSERKRSRRRAWRGLQRLIANAERREQRTLRAIAVERERGRRGDDTSLLVAAAIEMLSRLRTDELTPAYRERVRRARAARARVTALQGDQLTMRAKLLKQFTLNRMVPVRFDAILRTSDAVLFEVRSDGTLTWAYKSASVETYRRVVAGRKGGAS